MICCRLRNFFKINFFQKIPSGLSSEGQTVWVPNQARHFVGPDLDPNCFQRFLADDTTR